MHTLVANKDIQIPSKQTKIDDKICKKFAAHWTNYRTYNPDFLYLSAPDDNDGYITCLLYTNVGCKCRATTHKTMTTSQKIMTEEKAEIQIIDNKITKDTVLFFDMDGTLVDTNLANFLSYKKAILSVTKLDHDLIYNSDKRFNRSSLKNVVPKLTENEYEKIIQQKEEYYNDFLHETKLIVETADILIKYFKTNKTVLVSNCRKDRAMTTLKYFGLDDKFSNIFCREFDDKGKKINKFQNAILRLGIPPNLVIAFENEEIEIADAQKAGISIINPIH